MELVSFWIFQLAKMLYVLFSLDLFQMHGAVERRVSPARRFLRFDHAGQSRRRVGVQTLLGFFAVCKTFIRADIKDFQQFTIPGIPNEPLFTGSTLTKLETKHFYSFQKPNGSLYWRGEGVVPCSAGVKPSSVD